MNDGAAQTDQDPADVSQAPTEKEIRTERKRVLIDEIRTELKTQAGLKKEILSELKPTSFKTEFLEFTKHPVLLLIIGAVFGGYLSSCYQHREWNRQQKQLSEKQRIETKITTRDEVTDSIIEAYSAAESAVRPFFYENAKTFTAVEEDREKEWADATRKWQHARLKLRQKLDLYFTDPAIQAKFAEIVDLTNKNGNLLFVEVNNALGTVKSNPTLLNESTKPVAKQSSQYTELKEGIRQNILGMTTQAMPKTKELRVLMQQEIEKESNSDINQAWKWYLLDSWW
jgi:hypothetical protein